MTNHAKVLFLSFIVGAVLPLAGCGNKVLETMNAVAIAASAAAPICPTLKENADACTKYDTLVNQDILASLPIVQDASLNAPQVAAQLLPIWSNLATAVFPTTNNKIVILQAAVNTFIEFVELYAPAIHANTQQSSNVAVIVAISPRDALKLKNAAQANLDVLNSNN